MMYYNKYYIDLGSYTDKPILVGRDLGKRVRQECKVDDMIKSKDFFCVVDISPKTLTIASSFFFELFGDAVKKLGKEKFLDSFDFSIPKENAIYRGIIFDIDAILHKRSWEV